WRRQRQNPMAVAGREPDAGRGRRSRRLRFGFFLHASGTPVNSRQYPPRGRRRRGFESPWFFASSLFARGVDLRDFPAVTASRIDLISTLKQGGSVSIYGHNWFRSAVIVGQTALGIMLTASAGLLITSFTNLTHRNKGF